MSKNMKIQMIKNGILTINGEDYEGTNFQINTENGSLVIDGEHIDVINERVINITTTNTIEHLTNTNGDISAYCIEEVHTVNSDIDCHYVDGDVETVNGNINCDDISGNVNTIYGDIGTKVTVDL